MNTTVLFNRIELLLADLQKQVLDFIDFLILKYRLPNMEEDELTPEQKEELLRIWEEYEQCTFFICPNTART